MLNRLTDKSLYPEEVPILVEGILKIAADGGDFTLDEVNRRLRVEGWADQIVDSCVFEMTLLLLEGRDEYEVTHCLLH